MSPLVGVIMGSDSDWPVMQAAAQALAEFDVPHEVRVLSAHRTPREMLEWASAADWRGLEVVIAGAGGAARLPGMVVSMTPLPVIGVPVPLKHLDGIVASVAKGAIGELKYAEGSALPKSASEYFAQSVWVGASFPSKADLAARDLLQSDRLMWGSDWPYSLLNGDYARVWREAVEIITTVAGADGARRILGDTPARLYRLGDIATDNHSSHGEHADGRAN